MNQSRVLRYVRITNSNKLSDRYVTTQVKQASDPDDRVKGRLFAIVEIENAWYPSSQIGQTIINTASREYFKGSDSDALVNFETALKKVNDTLGHLAQTGESEWPESLHAVLALQVDEQIHIATVGGVRGWLVRDGKSSPIFEPTGSASSPSKTFSSVLSGDLEPGDRLLLASSGIFKVINKTELTTNVVAATDLAAAAIRLANLLKTKRGQWVNAILVDYQDEAVLAQQPAYNLPETLYLDTGNVTDWRMTVNQTLQRSREGIVLVGSRLNRLNKTIDRFIRTKFWPRSKQALKSSRDWSSKQIEHLQTKTLPAVQDQVSSVKETVQQRPTPEPGTDEAESLIGKSVFAIHDYSSDTPAPELEEDEVNDRVKHYTQPTGRQSAPTATPSRPSLRLPSVNVSKWRHLLSGRSLWFTIAAIVLLILLVVNISALTTDRSEELSRTQAAQRLTELQDQLEEAKLAKIFNQRDAAVSAAQTVLTGAQELATSPLADDASEVADAAQGVLDDLTSTKRLTGETVIEATGNSILTWSDIVALGSEKGIQTAKQDGGETATVEIPNSEGLAAMTAFDEKDGMAVLTDTPAIYETSSAAGPLNFIDPGGSDWKAGVAIAPFFNNLYILSPSDNQVWKYASTEGHYSAAEEFITDGTEISGAIDLAIDGNIYVLRDSGEIIKFTRGSRVEFSVRDVPSPTDSFDDPKQIVAANDSIYVLDSNRIVKLADDGRFVDQYALRDSNTILSISITDTTLFLLTDSSVVKTDL